MPIVSYFFLKVNQKILDKQPKSHYNIVVWRVTEVVITSLTRNVVATLQRYFSEMPITSGLQPSARQRKNGSSNENSNKTE